MKILERRILPCLLLVITTIVVVTAGVAHYRARRAIIAARQYISDAYRLQVGVSGSHEFAEIRHRYRHFAKIDPNCNDNDCNASFQFDNGWPAGIHLAHSAILYSGLTLSHGSITSSVIRSSCYGKEGGEFIAVMWESLPNASHDIPFREGRTMSSADRVATISFNLTPAASPEQRASAYAFHEVFLGRFGACNDARDMH